MNGKGSKPRPMDVEYSTYKDNWDNIFAKKENKMVEHPRTVQITEEISKYFSDDGKKEAIVCKTQDGKFVVELYEKSRYIRTVDVRIHSLNYAEDCAENYVKGWGDV